MNVVPNLYDCLMWNIKKELFGESINWTLYGQNKKTGIFFKTSFMSYRRKSYRFEMASK